MLTQTLDRGRALQAQSHEASPMIRRIQREYDEMPGLTLTEAQARRRWNLDRDTCRRVLATLIARRFLRRTATGMYVRAA